MVIWMTHYSMDYWETKLAFCEVFTVAFSLYKLKKETEIVKQHFSESYVYWTVHHLYSCVKGKTNLMPLILLFIQYSFITHYYKCRNTIANLTKPHRDLHTPPHNKWGGVWSNLSYVGQTGHSLNIRFQEHIRYIRYNNPQLAYALHILQNQHEYGPMNSTMTLLKPLNNPSLLLPYEQYYIQSLHQAGRLIPEQSTGETNPLFQTAINPQPPHPTSAGQ